MKRDSEAGQTAVFAMVWMLLVGVTIFTLAVSFGYLTMSANLVERTVQDAAKSSGTAGMIPHSLAEGAPLFDVTAVKQAADQVLEANLGLSAVTFAPQPGSPFASPPSIQVVVTNGPFPATIDVPFTSVVLHESYPTVVVAVQGSLRNWTGHTVQGTYWAAARIYEPGAPP